MLDYAVMGGILLFLMLLLMAGAKYHPHGNDGFFDQRNSKAMRGFWCLIVILVHVPQSYQNAIQDMIGSFAYIGVTFFFMTSAYGLSVGAHNKPQQISHFWEARLPKLILPNWVANVVFALVFSILFGSGINISRLVAINGWIKWLLGCYLAFWIGHYFHWKEKLRNPIVCVLVFILSISFYCMQLSGIVTSTTWCPESFGFIWGILLFAHYDNIKKFFLRKWFAKACSFCLLSLILGISYLLFKPVVFWGNYVLKIVLGLSILSFILTLNGKIGLGNQVSCFLGDISFEIYLLHGYAFKLIAAAFPGISSGFFILASILLTVLLSMIIHKICNVLLSALYSRKGKGIF